jgi:nucleotide-binding universal stress UspA family protein
MTALEDARTSMQTYGIEQVHIALSQGTPAREVVRFARDGSYDLIVLGSRARAGLAELVSRSVVEQVMRRALCTVVTVHLN